MKYICLDCREAKTTQGRRVIFAQSYTLKEAQEHATGFNHTLAQVDGKGFIKSVIRWGVFGYTTKVKNKLPDFLKGYTTQDRLGKK